MEREAEAEKTGRPPETKLTKDRDRARCLGSQSGESLHWKWENKVRRGGRWENETEGEIKWTAQERGGKTGGDRGIPQWHLISLSLSCSPSPYKSLLFLPINHSDFSLTNSFPAGSRKKKKNCNNLSLICYLSLSLTPSSSCLCLVCSTPSLTHTNTLLMHSLRQWHWQRRWGCVALCRTELQNYAWKITQNSTYYNLIASVHYGPKIWFIQFS